MENSSKRPSRITIPKRAHPLAKVVFQLMRDTNTTYDHLEFYSGVLKTTFKAWRSHNKPGLDTIEAALGYFGWSVLPVPPPSALPEDLRRDLEAVAEKHGRSFSVLEFISAAVGRRPNTRVPLSVVEGRCPVSRQPGRPAQQSALAA